MERVLVLSFLAENDKTVTVTIKNPKENLTTEQVRPVMEKIIATKIFNNAKHTLTKIKKIAYVTRVEEPLA